MSEVVLCALITGGFAWLTARTNARANATNKEIMARLDRVEQRQTAEALISERNDLMTAIHTDPTNTEEIMNVAKHYFLDLNGNSYASKPFARWAVKYQVDISGLYTSHNDLEFYIKNPNLLQN